MWSSRRECLESGKHMANMDIVIVNWNSRDYLRKCIASIVQAAAMRPGIVQSVVVVDNASTDDSLAGIDRLGMPVRIVHNRVNAGFSSACNQGAFLGQAQCILFLNPDAMASPESLQASIDVMNHPDHARVGICGVRLVDETGRSARSCARFPSPGMFLAKSFGLDRILPRLFRTHHMSEWDHLSTRKVDHVIGAYYLIRRPLFEKLNGFDERYFVYLEDLDLSYRASRLGYSTLFIADVCAFHHGGGTSEQVKATRLFYSLRSRMLYAFKNFGSVQGSLVAVSTLCVEPLSRFLLALLQRSPRSVVETLRGYGHLWAWFVQYLVNGKTR